MSMVTNTLGRYFAGRFVVAAIGVFAAIFVLLVLVDYIEMVRKTSGLVDVSAIAVAETSLFRVPQLLEKMMPFCILIGAMTCYLALSRRLELVVARAAGVSAWQFIAPALASAMVLGALATTRAADRTRPASCSNAGEVIRSGYKDEVVAMDDDLAAPAHPLRGPLRMYSDQALGKDVTIRARDLHGVVRPEGAGRPRDSSRQQ